MEELETGGDAVLETIERERETIRTLLMCRTSHQESEYRKTGL